MWKYALIVVGIYAYGIYSIVPAVAERINVVLEPLRAALGA